MDSSQTVAKAPTDSSAKLITFTGNQNFNHFCHQLKFAPRLTGMGTQTSGCPLAKTLRWSRRKYHHKRMAGVSLNGWVCPGTLATNIVAVNSATSQASS